MRSNTLSRISMASPSVAPTPEPSLERCAVCGFAEVPTDLVIDHSLMVLAECPRCEHRWTREGRPLVRVEFERVPLDESLGEPSYEFREAS
ncbi:hypothetical protein MK489_17825 [Myxococcota bacterium]|nr:hypothetical protein [Myxococcota bacterium]